MPTGYITGYWSYFNYEEPRGPVGAATTGSDPNHESRVFKMGQQPRVPKAFAQEIGASVRKAATMEVRDGKLVGDIQKLLRRTSQAANCRKQSGRDSRSRHDFTMKQITDRLCRQMKSNCG
jgi:hypothetical protein